MYINIINYQSINQSIK